MAKVTDPGLLQRLNAPPDYTDPEVRNAAIADVYNADADAPAPTAAPAAKSKKVRDPALLAKLNNPNADTNFGENMMTGIHEGMTNRGLGVIQTGYEVMKTLGMIEPHPEFEAAIERAHQKVETGAKGSGVGGFLGEVVGDPINWIGGGAAAGERAAMKQAGMSAMKKAVAKGAGEQGAKAAARKAVTKQLMKDGAKAGAKIGAASSATGVKEKGVSVPFAGNQGSTGNDLADRALQTVVGGATGAATGAVVPVVAGGIGSTVRGAGNMASDIAAAGKSGMGRTPEELNNAVAAMKKEGGQLANKMRDQNVAISPRDAQLIASRVRQGLAKSGLDPDLHPETIKALSELEQRAKGQFKGDVNGNPGLDIVSLDNIRKKLGGARGEDAGTAGQFRAAMESALEDPSMFKGAPPAALDIRDQFLNQWKKASRFEDVSELANKANSDPNRIRTVVNKFTDDPANRGKFTNDEWDALVRAGSRTVGDKIAGLVGSLGVDMGSISRNPRALFPWLMSTAKSGGGYVLGGPAPVIIGTAANSVKNRVANGRLEKALRIIEERDVTPPARPPAPPAPPLSLPAPGYRAPMTPSQVQAAQAQMATAPTGVAGTVGNKPWMQSTKTGTSGVPFDYGDVPYNYQAGGAAPQPLALPAPGTVYEPTNPEIIAAPFQPGRVSTGAEMATNADARAAMQATGQTPDILRVQRNNQVSAAEAQKAIQDAAAAASRADQVAGSAPPVTIGDMLNEAQQAAQARAVAVGEQPPEMGSVGQALAEAVAQNGKRKPLRITISKDPNIGPDGLPRVNLPGN